MKQLNEQVRAQVWGPLWTQVRRRLKGEMGQTQIGNPVELQVWAIRIPVDTQVRSDVYSMNNEAALTL